LHKLTHYPQAKENVRKLSSLAHMARQAKENVRKLSSLAHMAAGNTDANFVEAAVFVHMGE